MLAHRSGRRGVLAAGKLQPRHRLRVVHQAVARVYLHNAPGVHHRDAIAEPQRLVDIVTHVQNRTLVGLEQAHEVLLEHPLQVRVQGAEGLVQHEDAGARRQHAGQGHALLLAAGELGRVALSEAAQPEALQLLGHQSLPLGPRHLAPDARGNVVGHGEVREQHVVLEQERRLALLRRQVHPGLRVEEHLAVHHDASLIRRLDAGNAAQREALAAARRPQKAQRLVAGLEGHVQRVVAEALPNIDTQAHRAPPSLATAPISAISARSRPLSRSPCPWAPPRRPSRGGLGERPSAGAFWR